ncbi:universal stress protein [Maribellus maritimus]|uniref:universal stress protein n=1 Tax=Maribellus maritimus TaxID=2870838 RepID=UPI001EECB2C7|nr:universal stress protein [Maribellus maritimus]MCG6186792.1 universal stress protein [Maribellus maritimus]
MENQLVTILRITKPQVGSFVKRRFESEGIECFFTNEGLKMGGVYNPDEVLLKVKAGKSEKAIKLLLNMHREYDLDTLSEDASYAQMKKILLPVKMSEGCLELCKFAISVAQKNNAEIKLLYVYEDPTIHNSAKHTVSWEKHVKMELQEAHKKAQLKLVNFSLEIKKIVPNDLLRSVNLHYRMLKGIPEHVVVDAAERYQPDIILMGSKGEYEKANEFHGKTIAKVIEHSNFPVLVVPPKADFEGKDKINVMYATDFYDSDNSSLNKLLAILQAFDKQIYCVHIDLNDDSHHQEKVNELNKLLARDYSVHNIKCVLFESDNVVKGLETFAESNDIDVISFSKMKRSSFYKMFHSSLLERIVLVENIPILIFPV